MFRRELKPGEALLFVNPRETITDAAIHMLFVGMPLGVVWLDSEWRVVDTVLAQPWRMHYAPRLPAQYILEGDPQLLKSLTLNTKATLLPSNADVDQTASELIRQI
jgi:uncharacterized membrane protein (UPF0127 family)